MTLLSLLAAASTTATDAAAGAPTHLNPVKLFLDADIVVQVVMIGLILASVWVWMIIVGFSLRMGSVRRRSAAYEEDFWKARDFEAFQNERGRGDVPSAKVAAAGFAEWKRSATGKVLDREGARQRLTLAIDSAVAQEADNLANRLNFLATVGSVAPFVGLFGTVWGIMNSFFQIGQQQNSSLAVVAPGISEALFATAIGLFAAIPAVIAYNRFSHRVNGFEASLQRFGDRFHASLSRQLEG
ncbi:protein TolQ [Novosphingobium sp. JCM 18896]|uniref:protein TolQ n=1 Tax=Novosphingobium sp. JCM 18896 TaxID=2989731 RepID=UPI002222C49D|nr:protein TolQ [Novosphingobium sp. JCM 18896]MCW1430379.1 protein TolQ [Novosphingobium sp. JCM 18896]